VTTGSVVVVVGCVVVVVGGLVVVVVGADVPLSPVEVGVVEGVDVVVVDVAGERVGFVSVTVVVELAPGCSLATRTPMSPVAPVAAITAVRVSRRTRVLARSLALRVLYSLGWVIGDDRLFSSTFVHSRWLGFR
jgi:hypothetical protein